MNSERMLKELRYLRKRKITKWRQKQENKMSYKCRYTLLPECGEFEKGDTTQAEGLTDAFVFTSILRNKDGSWFSATFSFDGANDGEPITDTELFEVWAVMTSKLRNAESCTNWQQEIAGRVFADIQERLKGEGDVR